MTGLTTGSLKSRISDVGKANTLTDRLGYVFCLKVADSLAKSECGIIRQISKDEDLKTLGEVPVRKWSMVKGLRHENFKTNGFDKFRLACRSMCSSKQMISF